LYFLRFSAYLYYILIFLSSQEAQFIFQKIRKKSRKTAAFSHKFSKPPCKSALLRVK